MIDFASAAMLRLIRLGLQRQGIALPMQPPTRTAHVPLRDKRALADGLLAQYGAQVILKVGEGVRDAPEEPTLTALTAASSPLDLLERWQRLERFVHSRHRVLVAAAGPGGARLHHVSLDPRLPPSAAEDLLVIGLLLALLQRIGTTRLHAEPVASSTECRSIRLSNGTWIAGALPADVAQWDLQWGTGVHVVPERPANRSDWLEQIGAALKADPGRRWTVATLAQQLGTSPRSLQRHLCASGTNFTTLLVERRLGASAQLLTDTPRQLAEIGYICGFSDQAHFSRTFKRLTAFTPIKFRESFAQPALRPLRAQSLVNAAVAPR